MPEIVWLKPHVVEMPGQANGNFNGVALVPITKLAVVSGASAGCSLNTGLNPLGVCLQDNVIATQTFGYMTDGEIAGFDPTGINAHDLVYPSAAVPGGLATGAEKLANSLPCGRVTNDVARIKIRTL